MEGIRRALVISVLSRGWAAALSLLAVPLYLRFLGVEAYGVIGVFTSFSILVGFLDLGLGATLTRELARFSAKTASLGESRDLLRTFEVAYAVIALFIGSLIIFTSGAVAQHWVQAQKLQNSTIAQALALAGVALACQWPTNLYNAGLSGIQRQVQMGGATIVFGTFRVLLALVTVRWVPSLEVFFLAQIGSAILQTLTMRWLLWKALKLNEHEPRFRISIIKSSFGFASGMTGIAVTSIILTQTDKVILSRSLSLADFGVYVVAGTLATGLYMLITPMYSVIYPRFSLLFHSGDKEKLVDLYHTSSQVMVALIFPVGVVVAIFAREILQLWTGSAEISQKGSLILGFLIAGNTINGLMNIPFAIQLALGWTSLAFWLNIVFITLLAPAIWLAATYYGAVGGAAVWLILNSLCLLIVPNLMHRKILRGQARSWYWNSAIKPMVVLIPLVCLIQGVFYDRLDVSAVVRVLFVWIMLSAALVLVLPKTRFLFLSKIKTGSSVIN